MNPGINMLEGAPDWFATLAGLSVQAVGLAVIVFLITRLLGRFIPPAWRALLWFVVIARVLIPIAPPSPWSLQNFFVKEPTPAAIPAQPTFQVQTEFIPGTNPVDVPGFSLAPSLSTAPPPVFQISKGSMVTLIWAIGAGFCFLALAARYVIIRRHLSVKNGDTSSLVAAALFESRKKMRIRYPIRVVTCDRIAAPALTGLFPARLIIPTNLAAQNLTPDELHDILRHELAHLQQGHLFLHWLALIARALNWFNPAIHFAAAQLRRECELAADAAALKDSTPKERAAYGETLLKILSHNIAPSSQLAIGMAEHARHLEQRLRALTAPSRQSFHALGAAILVVVTISGLSGADNKVPAPIPAPLAEKVETTSPTSADPIHDARFLIEMGRLSEAETLLKAMAKTNPENRQVFYYLNLVKERKYAQSERITIAQGRDISPFARTNSIETSSGRRKLNEKLDSIEIDDLPLPLPGGADLAEVLQMLNKEVKRRDISGRGVNFLIAPSLERASGTTLNPITGSAITNQSSPPIDPGKFQITFDPPIRNVTLRRFLDALVAVARPPQNGPAGARLKYSVEDYAVVFSNVDDATPAPRFTRSYRLDPDFLRQRLEATVFSANPFRGPVGGEQTNGTTGVPGGFFSFGGSQKAEPKPNEGGGVASVTVVTNLSALQNQLREFFAQAGVDFPVVKASSPSDPPQNAMFFNDRANILFVRATLKDLDIIENALHALTVATSEAVPGAAKVEPKPSSAIGNTNGHNLEVRPRGGETSEPSQSVTQPPIDSHMLDSIRITYFALRKETTLQEAISELANAILSSTNLERRIRIGFAPRRGLSPVVSSSIRLHRSTLNIENYRVRFDAPLQDVSLRQVLDALVLVAKPPADASSTNFRLKYFAEPYAVVFSDVEVEEEPELQSRTFRVNPNYIALALERNMRPSVADPAAFRTNLQIALRHFFTAAGVEIPLASEKGEAVSQGRKSMFYNDRNGVLFVRATAEDLDRVEKALRTIPMSPTQITLEAHGAEIKAETVDDIFGNATLTRRLIVTNEFLTALPRGAAGSQVTLNASRELAAELKVPVASTLKTLEAREYLISPKQLGPLLADLKIQELMTMASVTTIPGRWAKVSVEEVRSVMTEDTQIKDNKIQSGAVLCADGPSVLLFPRVVSEDQSLYDVTFQNTEFLGYADDKKIPLPKFLVTSGGASIAMPNGHTHAIVHPSARDPKVWMVQLFTPHALDPAGNRVADTFERK